MRACAIKLKTGNLYDMMPNLRTGHKRVETGEAMRTVGTIIVAFAMWLGLAAAGYCDVRHTMPLDSGWRFVRHDIADGGAISLDETGWDKVDLPHSFNVSAASGPPDTYRGPAWYRRVFTFSPVAGTRTYIEFDGAGLAADVWLNGTKVGRHEGGFARFRFDITGQVKPGPNHLAVRVDNAKLADVAPLGGDFTMFGGLYRSVRLVTTSDVHLDMLDYGASGAYFTANRVTADGADITWAVRVANDRDASAHITVMATLTASRPVQVLSQDVIIPAHTVQSVALSGHLDQPHLWNGIGDPFVYGADVSVANEDTKSLLDAIHTTVGIRDIRIDPDKGLLLNSQPYNVHGVNIHQTMRPGKGPAVTDADMDADFTQLNDMGVTGLRFAHYQHAPHEYDIADAKGFLVWTEASFVSEVGASEAFIANASQQLRELIRQNYNHPSVMVWGLGNEIYKVDDASAKLLDAMQVLAHQEDPSRPTVYANCCADIDGPQASHTDLIASNVYFGWYTGEFTDLGPWLAANHMKRPTTPEGLSEYGAGASIIHQEDPPHRVTPASHWHPEQYQALYHEAAWRQIRQSPWLWSSFVWVGFDFPSAGRNEGDRAGVNDKGLITFDRKTLKDAYFWYQANWTQKPMVYITSRRYTVRSRPDVEVKIYSNQSSVGLTLNGVDQGAQPVIDHVAEWKVSLFPGRNHITATSSGISDAVDWIYQPVKAMP